MKTTVIRQATDGAIEEVPGAKLTKAGIYKFSPNFTSLNPKWRVVVSVSDFDPTKIVRLIVEENRPIRQVDPHEDRPFVPVTGETLTVTFSS